MLLRRADQDRRDQTPGPSSPKQAWSPRETSAGVEALDLFIKGIQVELSKPIEALGQDDHDNQILSDDLYGEHESEGILFNLERLHDLVCGVGLRSI